jgi:4-alpha-glucanotransferase
MSLRALVREALHLLGVRRFLLGIHEAALPAFPDEDAGRGALSSRGAAELIALAADLGFDGLQLGPSGATSRVNASPYDGTLFARNPLSVALPPLAGEAWAHLLPPAALEAALAAGRGGGARVDHARAHDAVAAALDAAARAWAARRAAGERGALAEIGRRFAAFRARHGDWLERDALYEVLQREEGGATWTRWGDPARRALFADASPGAAQAAARAALLAARAPEVERYAFVQFLAHEAHAAFREAVRARGLLVFADLQIGMSDRDAWAAQRFLLPGWRMGAPPSRTDPAGQAWGFPVLDPRHYEEPGPSGRRLPGAALRFVAARAAKVFAEHDGARIDHPHGLVCPWVYREEGDPAAAVLAGARLFESPDLPDVPELAAFAIARPAQLDRTQPRHGDGWVRSLDAGQVERYAVLLDAVVERAPDRRDVACEILSTQPHPLGRVIARHRLGRFRVTQKANLARADDVYRSENAAPEDWIMLGNHDTRPVWLVAERWVAAGEGPARAAHLAARLAPPGEDAGAWARPLASDARALAQGSFAELFAGPAGHVLVYFTDLFGAREPYNVPGTVGPHNWSLRLPADFRTRYAAAAEGGDALHVPRALACALRGRSHALGSRALELARALEAAPPVG